MRKVVTFGEIMLRLSPGGHYRFLQNGSFEATFGGAEANVAVSLANFGVETSFVTRLPDHAIGRGAAQALRAFGVDTSGIVYGGERIGVYYLEKGAGERGSVCIYDRKHSAISEATPDDFDWDAIFQDADWFHFTGITPALGGYLPEICEVACKAAKRLGLTVSCDLNYRSKLWTREQAGAVMDRLCRCTDVLFANEEDALRVFGIAAADSDVTAGKLDKSGYMSVARQLRDRFGCGKVAITLRTSLSASDNLWQGLVFDGEEFAFSREHSIRIVDRVGGGDSFAAGLIYALRKQTDAQYAVEFAAAASAFAQTIEGDFNRVTEDEVLRLMRGDASGRVRR
ncbi:MAG: sugar kinase [Clostridia bacterium]|nr:sugar kinase [Clostridia bacterium]